MADTSKLRGPQHAGTFASWLSLIGRLGVGQIFIFAGLVKVADPAEVARSIQAFDVVNNDSMISLAAYVLPWTEIIAGLLLVAGLFTRAAATVILLMLAGFVALIVNAMNQGKELECGCFGKIKLFCDGPLGRCNLIQDGVFAALALLPLILGGGRASADALGKAKATDPYADYGEDEDEAFD